jgi:hypothetical protein
LVKDYVTASFAGLAGIESGSDRVNEHLTSAMELASSWEFKGLDFCATIDSYVSPLRQLTLTTGFSLAAAIAAPFRG